MIHKKNKVIIIGGLGKSWKALELALKTKGASVICNGCVGKEAYEDIFPKLKEYKNMDPERCFVLEKKGKYYIENKIHSHINNPVEFANALVLGCDYGKLTKGDTIVYDDAAWGDSKNNLFTLWQFSHAECGIIITANSFHSILKVRERDITEEMIKDISRYWNIIKVNHKRKEP